VAIDSTIPLQARGIAIDSPYQTLAQVGQLRGQQQNMAVRDQQLEMNRREMSAQDAAAQRDQRAMALFSRETPPTPGEVYSVFGPQDGAVILKGLSALKEQEFKTEAQVYDNIASTTGALLKLPEALRPDAYRLLRESYIKKGIPEDQIAPEYSLEAVQQYQQQALSAKEQIELGQPKLTSVAPGASVIDERNPQAGPVYTAPEREPAPPSNLDAAILDAERRGDQVAVERYMGLKERVAKAGRPPQQPPAAFNMIVQTPDGPQVVNVNDPNPMARPLVGQSGAQLPPAPTADMRNKVEGRRLVARSISAIEELSKQIITKVGPAQRADAIERGAEAVFGTDPEFRTYQDARTALAGNLAVAQQGSRPSDADIKAIWLPLVPDAYRDTSESAAMKWNLIKEMSNVATTTPAGPSKANPFR